MEEFFSASASKRLPVAIQKLPAPEQKAFVLLRMRRGESEISRELSIPLDEARAVVRRVQEALIRSGSLDLIKSPLFFQIDHPAKEEDSPGRPVQLAKEQIDMEDRIALDRFYDALKISLDQLPKQSRRLLDLWFNKEMKAKDIIIFYKNIGVDISSKKSIDETAVNDVFYALEKNIKELLELVRTNMKHDRIELTHSGLKTILNETGV